MGEGGASDETATAPPQFSHTASGADSDSEVAVRECGWDEWEERWMAGRGREAWVSNSGEVDQPVEVCMSYSRMCLSEEPERT